MASLGRRPIGLPMSRTGAGLCSLPSKRPPVESGGVRQIRHTLRYWVAWAPLGESAVNQRFGVAYVALSRWWRLHTARCISRMLSAYRPRPVLESRNFAIPAPSSKGGR